MMSSLISLLKAPYLYARIPATRRRTSPQRRLLLTENLPGKLRTDHFPGEAIRTRKKAPGKIGFFLVHAPWLLGDRQSKIYTTVAIPKYIVDFCNKRNIPIEDLSETRPATAATLLVDSKFEKSQLLEEVSDLPKWFNPHPGTQLGSASESDKPLFLYMPWIAEHGDTLISRINNPQDYNLVPFDIADIDYSAEQRRAISRFALTHPHVFRRMVIRRLVPLRSKAVGFIVTFDWLPVMRIIVSICQEMGIPTILIPHEAAFIDRNLYYRDVTAKASVPASDIILGWGSLQKEIFVERGYPEDNFISVGAPKFDAYFDYKPQLERTQFMRIFGLHPSKKTVLFASQPLDSQLNATSARESQRRAVLDLLTYCEANDAQLIVRLPPSKDDVLGSGVRRKVVASRHAAIDDATCYLVRPEEAIFHADVVSSINSTMLFEALLMGKAPLSLKYVDFEQIWERAGIPYAKSFEEVSDLLDTMLSGAWKKSDGGLAWAAGMFGTGIFDGQAATRIRTYLTKLALGQNSIPTAPTPIQKIARRQRLDVAAISSSELVRNTSQLFLSQMLSIETLQSSMGALRNLSSAEVFFQWGIQPTDRKERQQLVARALGKPIVVIEDGFIRSLQIGLSGEPGLSVIVDDTTAYYDATMQSGLERALESGADLSDEQLGRAHRAMKKIVNARVSKYNHAPDFEFDLGRKGRPKILIVDQRYGDQSIASGLATDLTFDLMLEEAVRFNPDHDIIIKRHPDAITGGKMAHYSDTLPQLDAEERERVFMMDRDINPFALFDAVDEVYVVSSTMGFEALMAGKRVHCYGVPFYSGWGATVDKQKLARRTRLRSVEEIFHFAYIEASRYVNPETGKAVEVEELVDYIKRRKNELLAAA